MITLRASAIPAFLRCPTSILYQPLVARTDSGKDGPAAAGTRIHAAISSAIRGNMDPIRALASDEAALAWRAVRVWNEGFTDSTGKQICPPLKDIEGVKLIEHPMKDEATGVTGTTDLLIDAGDVLIVLDWKSGRLDGDHTDQLRSYAALYLKPNSKWTRCLLLVLNLRLGNLDHTPDTREGIAAFWSDVAFKWGYAMSRHEECGADIAKIALEPHTTGPHCATCNAVAVCAAQKRALAAIQTETPLDLSEKSPDEIHRLYGVAKAIERCVETFRDAVKLRVGELGPIVASNGATLELKEESRVSLNGNALSLIPQEDWPLVATVSKSKAMDGIKLRLRAAAPGGKLGRGAIGDAESKFMQQAELIGAVEKSTIQKLSLTKGNNSVALPDGESQAQITQEVAANGG